MLTLNDIHHIMSELAERRPIFHSEADFQHEMAWQLREQTGSAPRLEYPFESKGNGKRLYIDIWLPGNGVALELKWYTGELSWTDQNWESFLLKEQGTESFMRYDFLKDVERLESLELSSYKTGFAILLANGSLLWRPRPTSYETPDEEFRLHERRKRATGCLKWSPRASASMKSAGRKEMICLKGSYPLAWKTYSELNVKKNGEFRYLAFQVNP